MQEKNFYTKVLKYSKKLKAIDLLGGKCQKCGENNFFKLCFHHKDREEKENKISHILTNKWSIIKKEVLKCELLCLNCHYELHEKEYKNSFRIDDKRFYFEYKKIERCEKCGYNKSINALHFHHLKDKKIEFRFLKENISSIEEIRFEIINELNKCQILCGNCHNLEHSEVEFFNDNFLLIKEKSINMREKSSKIDRELVKKMYSEGKKQIEIAKYLKCSKSIISDIMKELNEKYIAG